MSLCLAHTSRTGSRNPNCARQLDSRGRRIWLIQKKGRKDIIQPKFDDYVFTTQILSRCPQRKFRFFIKLDEVPIRLVFLTFLDGFTHRTWIVSVQGLFHCGIKTLLLRKL